MALRGAGVRANLEMARIGEASVLDIASERASRRRAATRGVEGARRRLVEPMLAFAREKAGAGFPTSSSAASTARASTCRAKLRRVTIRWGLVHARSTACLRRRAALNWRPLVGLVLAEPQRNPWAALPAGIVRKQLGLPAPAPGPGLFAFSDPERLKSAVAQAGFSDVQVVDQAVGWGPFDSAAHALTFISELAGPVAALMAAAPDEKRGVIEDEIRRAYAAFEKDARVVLPGVTWIVSGTRD